MAGQALIVAAPRARLKWAGPDRLLLVAMLDLRAPDSLDADRVLKLAAQSMFDTFAQSAMGTMVVDRQHRIVWISDGYKQFLPALGHAEDDFVGRRVEDVVPNTLMAHVVDTGRPILIDLLTNKAGTFLVCATRPARSSAPSAWCCWTTRRRRCSR